jgi:hypothetical protein
LDLLVRLPFDEAVAEVFDKKGYEYPGHHDGSSGGFILKLAEALVAKHKLCVCKQLQGCC